MDPSSQNQQTQDAADSSNPANPRKRRNRWGDATETTNESSVATTQQESTSTNNFTNAPIQSVVENSSPSEENAPKRKSRWSTAETTKIPGALSDEVLQQTVILKLQLQQVNQKLLTVVQDALKIEQDPNRSPSPPPKYDSNGKRTNTREVRMREALNNQRVKIIEDLIKLNPTFAPPLDFVKSKPFRRIFIPKSSDPTCNYIGLIIGPRGNTQKQMEMETGCKISIRGKGSAKEGSKGRATKQVDEDEELHVHIAGDTEENVDRASKMIEAILRPLDDKLNEHKQRQLKELALINGTFKEDDYCPICGEKGHRQFDCPLRAKSFKAAGVKCSICGDLSHPTRDCPLKEKGPTNESEKNLDSEYDNFLAELDGKTKSTDDLKGKEGSSDAANAPAPKKGQPMILAPIIDVVSRTPVNPTAIATALSSTALPVDPTQAAVSAALPAATTGAWPTTPAAVPTTTATTAATTAAAYNPYMYATANPYAAASAYQYYDYSAANTAATAISYDPATIAAAAAAAGYDPAVYTAYYQQYLQAYSAATSASPPPPPPSNP